MVQTYRHTASAARQPEMGCPMSPRMSLEERGARNVAHRPNPHAAVSAPAWQFQVSQSKAHLKLRFAIARSAAAVFLALIAATAVRADGRQVDAGPTGARGGSYQGVISHETVTVKKSQVIEINAAICDSLGRRSRNRRYRAAVRSLALYRRQEGRLDPADGHGA